MSDNVASSSSAPTAGLPTVEQINGWSRDRVKGFLQERRTELDLEDDDIDIIYAQRVKGDTFLDFNAVDFERWRIPGAPAKKLEKLIKQIKGEQPGAASSPDNSVHVFIDNSNLFIEGSKVVGQLENVNVYDDKQPNFLDFYVDHGLLVTTILDGRNMGSAFVVGSVPPPNDTLWDRARSHGCEVKTYKRNKSNKEKKVDTKLVCRAMRSIFTKKHSTLLLVAGDSDYCPLIEEAKEENWKIEIWFWDGSSLPLFSTGMSSELKNIASYKPLDNYYESFTYITGPNFTQNKYTLEINGNIIKNWQFRNETLMACFCELRLFGRWHWVDDTTAFLYFEKHKQLKDAKSLLERKYPGMVIWIVEKVIRRNSFRIPRGVKW